MDKTINELQVNKTIVGTVIVGGNKYIPYSDFMKAIFGSNYLNKIKKVNPLIVDYVFIVGGKKHISLMAVAVIFRECDDAELKQNIMSQIFQVKKYKPSYYERLYVGLQTLTLLTDTCEKLYKNVGKADIEQDYLLHQLENAENIKEVSNKLKSLRVERRLLKNDYMLFNYAKTTLENNNFNFKCIGNMLNRLKEIQHEINNPVYFKRDGSNRNEMEQKIKELSTKFKCS